MDQQTAAPTPDPTERKLPRNMQAILDWCEKNRPDLRPVIWAERNTNGFILLMTIGFEAGRVFQKENPDYPMGSDACPVYLAEATGESNHEPS